MNFRLFLWSKLFLLGILAVTFFPVEVFAEESTLKLPQRIQSSFFRAKILEVVESEEKESYGIPVFWQYVNVRILNGDEKGKELFLIYEMEVEHKEILAVEKGDVVVVERNNNPPVTYLITDRYRLGNVGIIFALFFGISVLFTRLQGVRAFAGLGISFALIFYFLLPKILAGGDPFVLSLIASCGIALFSIYTAHGFRLRTSIAVLSTLLTLGLSALFGYFFVEGSHLLGLGTEEAFLLRLSVDTVINLRGLLLGAILIGTLGILDDVTTAQAAAVEEIYKANTSLGFRELYIRGLSVGKEHILSLVNTLVLAYTGASFPLLLLFLTNETPVWITLNTEIVVEELIRMLVGSITLIFAVPITTVFAALAFRRKEKTS